MNLAIDDVEIKGQNKEILMEFFVDVAHFLRNTPDQEKK